MNLLSYWLASADVIAVDEENVHVEYGDFARTSHVPINQLSMHQFRDGTKFNIFWTT